jgi:hypothetical protein
MTLDTAWAEAEAALPEGFVVDGLRRLYVDGEPTNEWIARATDPPHRTNLDATRADMPKVVGQGPTPVAALRALTASLRASVR